MSLRILLVDDEEELVTALAERLGYRDIEAEYALDGRQALKMLGGGRFDAVILDLRLPGMDGEQVHAHIRRKHPAIPVLLITGHGAPPDELGLDPAEHYEILEKPVAIDVLIRKIKEVLEQS